MIAALPLEVFDFEQRQCHFGPDETDFYALYQALPT